MSTADETIYNLLNHLPKCSSIPTTNTKRYYRSLFASDEIHNVNKNKQSHRTMGLAVVSKPDPINPLRRRQHHIELPKIMPFTRTHRMPPIPKVNKQDIKKQLSVRKNFIEDNINRIKNSTAMRPRRYVVSDRRGNKFLIDGSGLEKDFIYKKDYGKIPIYLEARKKVPEQDQNRLKDNSMFSLSPEERLSLICNLKIRYEDTFAEYQRLPLSLETTSAIMKKTYLTNKLTSLERDIDFLEKYQQIFIVDNCSDKNSK